MRLIDADELFVKWQITMMKIGEPVSVMYILAAMSDLQQAPTVEAIPVEWINKYTNEHRTYMHAFSEMVACWYDEKEKREYEMASDMRDYCERYEPTYNPEDGSL